MDDEIYLSLHEAKEELAKRQNDTDLKAKVTDYLGDIPGQFLSEPRAVIFRNIISPNIEFLDFYKQAKEINCKPLGLEHTRDKFSTRNADKMALAKLPLILGRSKNGDFILQKRKIIDIKSSDNKTFREILTLGNESLPHFHRCMLRNYMGDDCEIFDLSDWLATQGDSASDYYNKFLALFICHGILFETFVTTGPEAEFTNKIVRPALEFVKKEFGVKPIIVKSIDDTTNLDYWTYYPGHMDIL